MTTPFGDIWSDWKKKREAFGPGFYLYLGTHRGVIRLYIENRFVNLDLESKGQALAALYQALLLYEIGIDARIIKAWMFDGFGSFPIKYHFVKADLLDKSVLDPKQ